MFSAGAEGVDRVVARRAGPPERGTGRRGRPRDCAHEHGFADTTKLLQNFMFGIDIPMIATINGPSVAHIESALLSDIPVALMALGDPSIGCEGDRLEHHWTARAAGSGSSKRSTTSTGTAVNRV